MFPVRSLRRSGDREGRLRAAALSAASDLPATPPIPRTVDPAPSPVTSTRALAWNSVYNVLGQVVPLLVAIVAIPMLVHGLGEARFGLLGVLWMFIAVMGSLGFGRAGTRFLALVLGQPGNGAAVRKIVMVTLGAQVVLGVVLAAVLALGAGPLAHRVLAMNPALANEAITSFLILAAAFPILTLSAALRGFLQASQRFASENAIGGVEGALGYFLAAVAVSVGWGVPGVVALQLGTRGLGVVVYAWAERDLLTRSPEVSTMPVPDVRAILGFGFWTTVSGAISPFLLYLDRLLLGTLVGVAAVGLYTAPYEAFTQVLLVSGSIAAVLFPAVSTLQGQGLHGELRRISRRAHLSVFGLIFPLAVGFAVLAGPGLRLWLGPAAAPESIRAVQVLAPGVLANALAMVPFATLHGLGRADVTGKLHLLELPIQVVVAWWMVSRWGVVGAAGAWSFRTILDSVLLHYAVSRLVRSADRGAR